MPPIIHPKTMYLRDHWRITRARGGDYGPVLELLAKVFPDKHFTMSFFWDMNRTWVVKDEKGTVIGTSSARLRGKGCGELHWICTAERHRRTGLASELCRRALAWMLDRGVHWVEVKQNPPTEAGTALYTALGFKEPNDGTTTVSLPIHAALSSR